MDTYYDSTRKRRRRGANGQLEARRLERTIRRRAVAFRRWTRVYGKTRFMTAKMMGISCRTLMQWEHGWNAQGLPVHPLGRPAEHSSPRRRKDVFGLLNDLGPHTGLPTLRAEFSDLTRGELADLLWEYRKARVMDDEIIVHTLEWKIVGATWAMDFTEPEFPVDGIYPYILAVRDLASRFCLLWLALEEATALVVSRVLKRLFDEYGEPLVIKKDGGSHFKGEVIKLLDDYGVTSLMSPPYTPEYNGSIESGIGNIKTHMYYEAARRGWPYDMTIEDLEGCRLRTNTMTRPFGHLGPTPAKKWLSRPPLYPAVRRVFRDSVSQFELDMHRELAYNVGDEIKKPEKERIRREAIGRACVAHGLLEVRRRRFSLPIISNKVTIFS